MTTRRSLLAALIAAPLLLTLLGCGYPVHIDPPTFYHETRAQSSEAARLHAQDISHAGGAGLVVPIVGETHSMGKLMGPGDLIVVDTKAPFSNRRVGEVLCYVGEGADWEGHPEDGPWITHRAVEKDAHGLLMSGDGNTRSEARSRVTAANYRGLVVGIYKTGAR